MPTVYADLKFLYFQIAAEQTSYGFSRGDLPEIFRMMMIQKVSSISLKLGTPTVYADLIFLYFQIAAE